MDIAEYLAAQGRDRFLPGDTPPDDVVEEIDTLVHEYRRAFGVGAPGLLPTAYEVNSALAWREEGQPWPTRLSF